MENKNELTPAEVLKNQIDSAIESKADEVSKVSLEAVETAKADMTAAIEKAAKEAAENAENITKAS